MNKRNKKSEFRNIDMTVRCGKCGQLIDVNMEVHDNHHLSGEIIKNGKETKTKN